MFKSKILLSITSVALLACAQQEEPAPMVMSAEPVYNKMGDVVGCTDGRTFSADGAQMDNPCAPPGDDCDPNAPTADPGYCPPPQRGDGGSRPDRTPDPQ